MAEYEALIQNLRSIDEYDTGYAKLIYDAADAIEELSGLVDHYGGETGIKDLEEYASKYWNLLKNAPRWIPVTERLPREQETVLTWGKQGVILLDWRHDNEWFCFREATHWMRLPEPPKEE